MKYNLVVYVNNEYHEINGYSKISGFEHLNENKLKDIVEFTNEFESEQILICFLIDEGLLKEKYFYGNLGIHYYKGKNSKPKLLQYGISSEEDKKFFDTIFLQYYYSHNLNNPKFIELFLGKYYNYLKNVGVFEEELNYIRYSYNQYVKYNKIPENAENYMASFVTTYCRKKSKDGYYKADFTRIRDLAMFAINYERNFIRQPQERPKHTVNDLEIMIDHYKNLLSNNNLNEEEQNAYNTTLSKLEKELEYTKIATLNRRKS